MGLSVFRKERYGVPHASDWHALDPVLINNVQIMAWFSFFCGCLYE